MAILGRTNSNINKATPAQKQKAPVDSNRYVRRMQETLKQEADQQIKKDQVERQQQNRQQDAQKEAAKDADSVKIGSFDWGQDMNGNYELKTTAGESILTSVDLKNDGQRILKESGQKIDMMGKLAQMKQTYMQSIVQSKSHNFFLSKYAQFKTGLTGQALSLLGVTQEELQKLQKEAIDGAVKENIELMQENLYNMVLTEIVHGRSRKTRGTMYMYAENEKQLIEQMNNLLGSQYWTPLRLYEERIKQAEKLREEFIREREALSYQFKMMVQEMG